MVKNFFRVFKIVFRFAAVPAFLFLFFSVLYGLSSPYTILFTQRLIDEAVHCFYTNQFTDKVFIDTVLLMTALGVLRHIYCVYDILKIALEKKISYSFSSYLMKKFTAVDFSYFEDPDFADCIQLMSKNPDKKILELFYNAVMLITTSVRVVGIIWVFYSVSIWLVVGFIIVTLHDAFWTARSALKMNTLFEAQAADRRKISDIMEITHNKHSLIEVQIFSSGNFILQKLHLIQTKLIRNLCAVWKQGEFYGATGSVSILSWMAFCIFFLIIGLKNGTVTAGMFAALLTAANEFGMIVSEAGNNFYSFIEKSIIIKYLFQFLELPNSIHYKIVN